MQKTLLDSYNEAVKKIEELNQRDAEKETALFYYSVNMLKVIGDSFSSFEIAVCYIFMNTQNDVHRLILIGKYAERCFVEKKYRLAINCYNIAQSIIGEHDDLKNPIFIRELVRITQIVGMSYYMDDKPEESKLTFGEALQLIELAEKDHVDMAIEKASVQKCLKEVEN